MSLQLLYLVFNIRKETKILLVVIWWSGFSRMIAYSLHDAHSQVLKTSVSASYMQLKLRLP
jgi:hypothetical protein